MSETIAKRKKRSFGYKIKKFADIYQSTDEYLGEGSCGTVSTFYNHEKNKEFAVKIVENSSKRVRKKVLKEIEILHHCKGHPNITQLVEFYEEDHRFYLVFEKMAGLTLLDWMERHGGIMGEAQVSDVAQGLASALQFLHRKGVAHRDLKLENVLCTSMEDIHPVKICDFDLSTDFGGGDHATNGESGSPGYGSGNEVCPPMETFNLNDLASAVGSADYMAPEVVRVWLNEESHYSEQCDIWSLGVVLYILLSGYKPFGGSRSEMCCCPSTQATLLCDYCKEEHFEQIKEGVVDMRGPGWGAVSEGAKDLVMRLLVKDPTKRLTASQVLGHEWVVDASVFTHAKSLPIPCHPLSNNQQLGSAEVHDGWANDSTDYLSNHGDHDNHHLDNCYLDNQSGGFNNTLVEDSLCATIAGRIFSLELEDPGGGGGGGGGGEVVVGDGGAVGAEVGGAVDSGLGDNERGGGVRGGDTVVGDGARSANEGDELNDEATSSPSSSSTSSSSSSSSLCPVDQGPLGVAEGASESVGEGGCVEKLLMFGSCDSGNVSGISLIGSPCILANNPLSNNNNPLSNNKNPLSNNNNPLSNNNNPLGNNNNPLSNNRVGCDRGVVDGGGCQKGMVDDGGEESGCMFNDVADGGCSVASDGLMAAGDGLMAAGDGLMAAGDGLMAAGDGLMAAGDGLMAAGDGLMAAGGGGMMIGAAASVRRGLVNGSGGLVVCGKDERIPLKKRNKRSVNNAGYTHKSTVPLYDAYANAQHNNTQTNYNNNYYYYNYNTQKNNNYNNNHNSLNNNYNNIQKFNNCNNNNFPGYRQNLSKHPNNYRHHSHCKQFNHQQRNNYNIRPNNNNNNVYNNTPNNEMYNNYSNNNNNNRSNGNNNYNNNNYNNNNYNNNNKCNNNSNKYKNNKYNNNNNNNNNKVKQADFLN